MYYFRVSTTVDHIYIYILLSYTFISIQYTHTDIIVTYTRFRGKIESLVLMTTLYIVVQVPKYNTTITFFREEYVLIVPLQKIKAIYILYTLV